SDSPAMSFFLHCSCDHPALHSFPTRRSSDLQMIFREYLRLLSMKRLIKLLDERGLRTRRGKRWSRAGVSWILKNDTYVGRVHFRSEEHTSELQSRENLVCRLLLEKKKKKTTT